MLSYFKRFFAYLSGIDGDLAARLKEVTGEIIERTSHGDLDRWLQLIERLPSVQPSCIELNRPAVRVGWPDDCDFYTLEQLQNDLMELHPWRKGPFDVFGIRIETEWRSYLKWERVKDAIDPLDGKVVLDVGSGNGYFGFRMVDAGAKAVVAIDPFMLFVVQFLAVNRYVGSPRLAVLPLKIEDLPKDRASFDTVFSMGVLYHRREPAEHLRDLFDLTLPGGEVVLETLVIDSPNEELLEPRGRYAKMRNVWAIPSPKLARRWMQDAGLSDVRIVDVTKTTLQEQRPTEWMTFESLPDYLDPEDDSRTIEGYPAPVRAVLVGRKV